MKDKFLIKDQEYFFNLEAKREKKITRTVFWDYSGKEMVEGFKWLKNAKKILDYGCGTGSTLDLYLEVTENYNAKIIGTDIAENAIEVIQKKYPQHKFYKIKNNEIPKIKNNSLDSAYLISVLHHTKNHEEIFNTISKKLKKNGKFFICDLTSNNPVVNIGRKIFVLMPKFIKNKFDEDLVIDGKIPEKYKVKVDEVIKKLQKSNFQIIKVGYGHLFFFLVAWLDKFLNMSKFRFFNRFLDLVLKTEDYFLKFNFFKNKCSLFFIKCVKKN